MQARPKSLGKMHVAPDRAIRTLCGRPVEAVTVAPNEDVATCQRCQHLLLVRARNQAYRVALRMVSMAASDLVTKGDPDHLLCEGLASIAEELRLRANGQLLARVIGPEILKRAAQRGERR